MTSRRADVTAEPRCCARPNNFFKATPHHGASTLPHTHCRDLTTSENAAERQYLDSQFTQLSLPFFSSLHFICLPCKMNKLCLLLLVGLATGFIGEKKLLAAADDMYLEGQTSGDLPIDDEDGDDDGSGSGSGDYAFSDISDKEELIRRFLLNISKTTVSKEMVPVQPQPSAVSPHIPSTTTAAADSPVQRVTEKTSPGGDNSVEEVPRAGPTADWFTEHTNPSSTSLPPNEDTTTTFSIDISVTKDSDEDNSLDRWDISTSRDGEGKVVISEEVDNEISASDRRINGDFSEEVTSENLWERTEVLAAVIACGVVGFLCAVFLLLLLAYRMKKKDEGSYDLGDTKLSTTAYHKAPSKEFYA